MMAQHRVRRMRSTAVSIGLVGALAVSLSGCGNAGQGGAFTGDPNVARQCVDEETLEVVEEGHCLQPTPSAGARSSTGRRYRHYYGGQPSGGRVSGGSFTALSGGNVETGGFGQTGRGKSGGASGGKSGGSSGGG